MRQILFITLLLISNYTMSQSIIYVDVNASGTNDGTNWTNAFTNLNSAISTSSNGDQIWVAEGSYSPGSNRTDTFNINKQIELYGGFNATESTLGERDYKSNVTTLTGDINNDDLGVDYTNNNRTENNYHVVSMNSSSIILDGFSIVSGHADGSGVDGQGAAISGDANGTHIIRNCTFSNNVNTRGGTLRYIDKSGTLSIENTIFKNNLANFAVLVYARTPAFQTFNINLINTLAHDNIQGGYDSGNGTGGFIWLRQDLGNVNNTFLNATITNCTFTKNRNLVNNTNANFINASRGNAIQATIDIDLSNTIFWDNLDSSSNEIVAIGRNNLSAEANIINVTNALSPDSFSNVSNTNIVTNLDPFFNDSANVDFTLSTTSPAINLGDDSKIPVSIIVDLNGDSRIQSGRTDLGCYESNYAPSNPPLYVKFVDKDATGANDGSSWANAFTDIQNAINLSNNGDELWVASGTYSPGSSRSDTFTINKNIKFYGSFQGNETTTDNRDFINNTTILSGDVLGNDTGLNYVGFNRTENNYRIIKMDSSEIILDGFEISGGHADGSGANGYGSAILSVSDGDHIIRNCTIKNNVIVGAGVTRFVDVSGSVTFDSTQFTNNLGNFGVLLITRVPFGKNLDITLNNCLAYDNIQGGYNSGNGIGGFFWFRQDSGDVSNTFQSVKIVNTTVTDNINIANTTNPNIFCHSRGNGSGANGSLEVEIYNSIIWNNLDNNNNEINSLTRNALTNDANSLIVSNNIAPDGFSNITNRTNTQNTDPLFIDSSINDYTLQLTSTALDSGDNAFITSGITTDLTGNERIDNGTVDLGCFELNCDTCFRLIVNIAGGGQVYTNGNPIPTETIYYSNDTVNLTAVSDTGFIFSNWSGDIASTDNPLQVLMDSDKTITANFTQVPIYVDQDAIGSNDGSSWANAFTNLQDALAVDYDNAEIWVAEGTYLPAGVSDKIASFTIDNNNVKLYGGFDGTETTLNQRDVFNYPTILSGDNLNNDNSVFNTSSNTKWDNAYHVTTINANNVFVDGFVISNGHAVSGASSQKVGAAMYVFDNSAAFEVRNCTFIDNAAIEGAGIRANINADTTIKIENNRFYNNISRKAAGLYILGKVNRTINVELTNCLFENNYTLDISGGTGSAGSAAWISPNENNCTINTNITNCTFANNFDNGTATVVERGPIVLSKRFTYLTHFVDVSNSIFYGNVDASNTATLSIAKANQEAPNNTYVFNSIGEDDFSNISFLNKTHTSNADPLFTDSSIRDFTLQPTSPAIDSGDNNYIPNGITTDLTGNVRIENTIVDMGCYEYKLAPILVSPKAFLQGALITSGTNTMDDSLRAGGLIPLISPYSDALNTTAPVLAVTGTDAIIDWVWVELRDKNDNMSIIASQSALIQADGNIVGVDGTSDIAFNLPTDDYFVVINHRNHLGIMTAATVSLTSTTTTVDYSLTGAFTLGGTNALINLSGVFAMIAGDYDGDGQVLNADVQNVIPLAGTSGYSAADADMNGQVLNTDIQNTIRPNAGKGQQF